MFDFLFFIILGNNLTSLLPNGKNKVISKVISPNRAPTADINDAFVTLSLVTGKKN